MTVSHFASCCLSSMKPAATAWFLNQSTPCGEAKEAVNTDGLFVFVSKKLTSPLIFCLMLKFVLWFGIPRNIPTLSSTIIVL